MGAPYSSAASYAAFTAELRPEVSWTAAQQHQQQVVEQRGQQLAASLRSSLRRVEPAGYATHLDESLLYVCKAEPPPPPPGQLDKTNVCRWVPEARRVAGRDGGTPSGTGLTEWLGRRNS